MSEKRSLLRQIEEKRATSQQQAVKAETATHRTTPPVTLPAEETIPTTVAAPPPIRRKPNNTSGLILIGGSLVVGAIILVAVVLDYRERLANGTAADAQFLQSLISRPEGQAAPAFSSIGGSPAPDFTVSTFNAGMFTLSEMRGRVVVVHFWASWCGYCRRDAPTIEALYHEYQTVEFIGISQDEDPDAAWRTAGEWRLSYPVGVDLSAGWNYGVNGIPATFVVDTEGRLIASLHGSGHENNIRAAIESALR